jgi:hypothetical protein
MAAGLAAGAAASQLLANVVYQASSRDPSWCWQPWLLPWA